MVKSETMNFAHLPKEIRLKIAKKLDIDGRIALKVPPGKLILPKSVRAKLARRPLVQEQHDYEPFVQLDKKRFLFFSPFCDYGPFSYIGHGEWWMSYNRTIWHKPL